MKTIVGCLLLALTEVALVAAAPPKVTRKVGWEAIERELARPPRAPLPSLRLLDALNEISFEHGITVFLSNPAADDYSSEPLYTPRIDPADRKPLGDVLTEMLAPHGFVWTIRHDALYITTRQDLENRMQVRVYKTLRVHSLSQQIRIQRNVEPKTWASAGGPGAVQALSPDLLVVSHNGRVHRLIEQRFQRVLRGIKVRTPKGIPRANGSGTTLSQRLEVTTHLQLIETPLDEVVAIVADVHGVAVELDREALEQAGLGDDIPVTETFVGMRLSSALSLLTDRLELTWGVKNGKIVITTLEAAEQSPVEVKYDVRRLTPDGQPDALIEAITSTVAPTSWQDVGGPGSIEAAPDGGALLVQQTFAVHREIEALLAALRLAQ